MHQTTCMLQAREAGKQPVLLHQADWIAGLLHSRWSTTDWNNCLKLGFDPAEERYPEWLMSQVKHRLSACGHLLHPKSGVLTFPKPWARSFLCCCRTMSSHQAVLLATFQLLPPRGSGCRPPAKLPQERQVGSARLRRPHGFSCSSWSKNQHRHFG